ncbi:MAG: hypothetical protein V3U89_04730 [Methylophilaceae bacterium]
MQESNISDHREKEAANAYLKFLQSKGASNGMLYLRSKFLDAFILKLTHKKQTCKEFSNALEDTMSTLTQEDRSFTLSTAREFFPFWMSDIKAIAMFEEYYGFNIHDTKWKPKSTTLAAITAELDEATLVKEERQSLNHYIQVITKLASDQSVIEARSKLAKIILIRLRGAPTANHAIYRLSVELTLPLFKTKEIKQLYLDVVREFYYFWINDQNAEAKIFG